MSQTCLPLAPCLHSGCSRCLFSLSFSFCLILLSVSVSMLLFCTPSVVCRLRLATFWLFSLFVCASRSFIISQLYIRSLLTVHRLRRVSRFVVCYITVPSVLCLCHPPVTSIIVRPPHHLFAFVVPFSFTASVAIVSVGPSSSEVTSPSMSVCSSFVPSLISSFFSGGTSTSTRGPLLIPFNARSTVLRSTASGRLLLLHQVWLMPSVDCVR